MAPAMTHSILLKILRADDWTAALAGADVSAPIDREDGYVHFSTADTVQETLSLWFAGVEDAYLIAFRAADFSESLKWEPARQGTLFPHVYGNVRADQAIKVWKLENLENGAPVAPQGALEMM